MDKWLDSLSDDWISQPRSSHSNSSLIQSPAPSILSQGSNAQQSRIPRYKARAASDCQMNEGTTAVRKLRRSTGDGKVPVLRERSQSNLNIPQNLDYQGNRSGKNSPPLRQPNKRAVSSGSLPLGSQETVQRKLSRFSNGKSPPQQPTPDWKKRVIQGSVAPGEQCNLFGPIGLEKVFRPPTIRSGTPKGQNVKSKVLTIEKCNQQSPQDPPLSAKGSRGRKEHPAGNQLSPSACTHASKLIHHISKDLAEKDMIAKAGSSRQTQKDSLTRSPDTLVSRTRRQLSDSNPQLKGNIRSDQSPTTESIDHDKHGGIQNDDRDEIISPLYVSRHHTMEGNVDYAALDMSLNQVLNHIGNLRREDAPLSSRMSDDGVSYAETKVQEDVLRPDLKEDEWTSHSLPDDLSVGADAFAFNSAFVNVRRGGYSSDGSFRKRPLSPSSLTPFDSSELKSSASPKSTLHSSTPKKTESMGSKRTSMATPTTPTNKAVAISNGRDQSKSSGSPLKLFDKYDTFTNDRLSRRMSKFEENLSRSPRSPSFEDTSTTNICSPRAITNTSSMPVQPHASDQPQVSHCLRAGSFGDGELDHHLFPSYPLNDFNLSSELKDNRRNELKINKSDPDPFKIIETSNFASHPKNHATDKATHDKGSPSEYHQNYTCDGLLEDNRESYKNEKSESIRTTLHNSHGKRLSQSPAKDPKPKRRRTIQRSHEAGNEILSLIDSGLLGSLSSRKRKDALYGSQNQAADPSVLAMRTILRPRASINGQNSLDDRANESAVNGDDPRTEEVDPLQESVDPSTQLLAGELANYTLNIAQDIASGSRKASMTTSDFFNEAQQIMQIIRAQGCQSTSPKSEVGSEGSNRQNSFFEESTKDEFSRPPSREGVSLRRYREPVKINPRVLSHLKKFEEKDDFETALSSSMRSLHIEKEDLQSCISNKEVYDLSRDECLESDPPNLRILSNKSKATGSEDSYMGNLSGLDTNIHVEGTGIQPTSNSSTERSIQTGSSRGSGTKAVIAPENVSHLLREKIAGMKLDHNRQVWVRHRSASITDDPEGNSRIGSELTEEDLLGEIPDLSVDELDEMQRIKAATTSFKKDSKGSFDFAYSAQAEVLKRISSSHELDVRPQTAEGAILVAEEDSSAPSKYSRLMSSGPIAETRATSWGDEMLRSKIPQQEASEQARTMENDIKGDEEDVEHEFSILEGRLSSTPGHLSKKSHQPRVVTVTFSSPLVDQMQTPSISDHQSGAWRDKADLPLDDSPIHFDPQPKTRTREGRARRLGRKSSYRTASRRSSFGSQVARPMSRLDEEDEVSLLQYSNGVHGADVNVIVATPAPFSNSMVISHPPSPGPQPSISFHLSPLADFTMHQVDRSLNHGEFTRREGLLASYEVQDRFSLATQQLVKHLTDIEPYEPYWDLIRCIDLQNKGLATLHRLQDFCQRIEELDVSNNSLDQLDGVPSNIRNLKICCNQLSDMTAWGHLQNLQYLDISRNQIRSLKAFQALFHLRELKADHNQIESLEGISGLDGLISLSLRGNALSKVDFAGFNLKRLSILDVSCNKISKLGHLHHLTGLKRLDINRNQLEDLELSARTLANLESLDVSINRITTIDVGFLPNLRVINLDNNTCVTVHGLTRLKHLETLSWRDQSLPSRSFGLPELQYQTCHNISNLYLSNNMLPSFAPPKPFLSLQALELASIGLKNLCPDFGVSMPNLRTLNLNYNALRDLRPLNGILRLQRLFVAGNRIMRLRQTVALLQSLGNELKEVDLRQNPLTMGFYTPLEGNVSSRTEAGNELILQQAATQAPTTSIHNPSAEIERTMAAFRLPAVNKQADHTARTRLDEDTKLRRKVYETLTLSACTSLQILDGITIDRSSLMPENNDEDEDGICDRLRELGLLQGGDSRNGSIEERKRKPRARKSTRKVAEQVPTRGDRRGACRGVG